ncbi:MAG: choice-of-anchor D domain-containing protein [Myxococcales bacterium]|nr:choice-of-anchor D domain-containing protein [Myxococcota bacterium]MDW8281581.1 choice-of-anchor D domain-containing protein [Myxococcales bacterium]
MRKQLCPLMPGWVSLALSIVFGFVGGLCGCGLPGEVLSADDDSGVEGVGWLGAAAETAAGTQAARLSVSPAELRFQARCPGTSESRTLQLRSTGAAAVRVLTLWVRGSAFRLVRPPVLPLELAPGEQVELTVRFTAPTGSGAAPTGSLVINSTDASRPSVSVPLSGSVLPVQFSIRPATLDFGLQRIGLPRVRYVELRNTSSCSVQVGGLEMSGSLADAVLMGDEGPEPFRPGESRTVDVVCLCNERGTIDARAQYFSTLRQPLGTLRVLGTCRP